MLVIRQDQLDKFPHGPFPDFENRMVAFSREHYSHECHKLSEEDLRMVIRFAWERAGEYEFEDESCVAQYLNLMFTFGAFFDEDPRFPWAASILNDPFVMDPEERMDRLNETASAVLKDLEEAHATKK